MVKACAVPQCLSGVTVQAFYFPKDVKLSQSWANKIQCPVIDELTSTERRKYRVCYKHFEEASFKYCIARTRLRDDAIPTLHLPVQSGIEEYAPEDTEAEVYPVCAMPQENDVNSNSEKAQCDINEHNEAGPSRSEVSEQLKPCQTPQRCHRSVLLQNNMRSSQLTPTASGLYKVAKQLMKRNRYVYRKKEDFRKHLERAMTLSETNLIHRFENLSAMQRMFIEMQLRTSRSMLQVDCSSEIIVLDLCALPVLREGYHTELIRYYSCAVPVPEDREDATLASPATPQTASPA